MNADLDRRGITTPVKRAGLSLGSAQAMAFITAFVTLAVQVLVYRLVSAKLVNNYAFLVVSFTMLGFAVSGVILTRASAWLLTRAQDAVLLASALFGISLLGVSVAVCRVAPGAQWVASPIQFVAAFAQLMPVSFLYALPFACCGLILGLLLSDPALPTARVYGWDLLGSALGAVAVVPAIATLGVERALLVASCLLLIVAMAYTPGASRPARLAALGAAVVLAVSLTAPSALFRMSYPEGSFLAAAATPGSGYVLEHVGWDPVARIEVTRIPTPHPDNVPWPFLIGDAPGFLSRFERVVTQNNTAFTYAPRYAGPGDDLDGLERTLYASAYEAATAPAPRVLVIGVGGGLDVLAALRYAPHSVTGVEINDETLRILRRVEADYFRGWVSDPRVRLVGAEGRHYLARHEDRYDVIQLTGVDTASGTPAAAHVFSESYIYTAEAFDLYLDRLTDAGVLNMMRSEWAVMPREMLRALVTATEALRRDGADRPERHIVTFTARSGMFTAMLVKKTPFLPIEEARLARWSTGNPHFALTAAPSVNARRENVYQKYLSLDTPAEQRRFVATYPFDIRPATDDRPFFFRHSYWWHLWSGAPALAHGVPVMEIGLTLLLATSLLVSVAVVYLPLRLLAADGVAVAGAGRHAAFFALLGLGYLAIEMAFLQRFGLFLGHPNHALSVVLASLLVGTGLGALVSESLVRRLGHLRRVAGALALLVLAEALLLPSLGDLVWLPFAARAAIVCMLVVPVGIALGTFFPWGLERLRRSTPQFAPWAWGLNGMASVIAPILAVGVSMTWGIGTLLVAAIPLYLMAGLLAPRESRPAS